MTISVSEPIEEGGVFADVRPNDLMRVVYVPKNASCRVSVSNAIRRVGGAILAAPVELSDPVAFQVPYQNMQATCLTAILCGGEMVSIARV